MSPRSCIICDTGRSGHRRIPNFGPGLPVGSKGGDIGEEDDVAALLHHLRHREERSQVHLLAIGPVIKGGDIGEESDAAAKYRPSREEERRT